MGEKIEIDVVAGLTRLTFTMGASTGGHRDTNPGVGFDFETTYLPNPRSDGTIHGGCGVISRTDAARLRDALEIFLKNHAAGIAA